MSKEEILAKLRESIAETDVDMAREAAEAAVDAGINATECIDEGLVLGMQDVSDMFDTGEAFVPDLLEAADAFGTAVGVLTSSMSDEEKQASKVGIAVIHTVEGDIHDIGKNIVATLFKANNFEIHDLGRDTAPPAVLEKAEEVNADIILGSALMTTTMPGQRSLIEYLTEKGVRDQYYVMFGGAPVTEKWVQDIGGDKYTDTATDAVAAARKYMASNKEKKHEQS